MKLNQVFITVTWLPKWNDRFNVKQILTANQSLRINFPLANHENYIARLKLFKVSYSLIQITDDVKIFVLFCLKQTRLPDELSHTLLWLLS